MYQSLFNIGTVLIEDQSSLDEVKSALQEYKTLLQGASIIDVKQSKHRSHVQLDTGIAIGLKWAASCLDDPIRTQKFIRGTKRAIEHKLTEKKCVHVLYAGTGPYATLILPLLSYFSSDQLIVTLLDVNPESIKNLTQIIECFNFEDHVHEIHCADATKISFKNASTFDILLTETMQHALQEELQLVISSHLINQMPEDALLIPQSINLDLVRLNPIGTQQLQHLGHLMRVDSDFLRAQHPIKTDWQFKQQFDLSEMEDTLNDLLAISTKITVFEEESIEHNESGLTVPKVLAPLVDFKQGILEMTYVIDPDPGFVWKSRK